MSWDAWSDPPANESEINSQSSIGREKALLGGNCLEKQERRTEIS